MKNFIVALLVLVGVFSAIGTVAALAQTSPVYVYEFDFDTDTEDFLPTANGTLLTWSQTVSYTYTCSWWQIGCTSWVSTADGVMQMEMNPAALSYQYGTFPDAVAERWIDLEPGTYRVYTRFSLPVGDSNTLTELPAYSLSFFYNNSVINVTNGGTGAWFNSAMLGERKYQEKYSDEFIIDRATPARMIISGGFLKNHEKLSIDFLKIEQVSTSYPTPNPALPTIAPYATPGAFPTPVCRVYTQTVPGFSMTPTPTPTPSGTVYKLGETFDNPTWQTWQKISNNNSNDVDWILGGRGFDFIGGGAVIMNVSPTTDTVTDRAGIGLGWTSPMTTPIYVSGWARTDDIIYAGGRVTVEVWALQSDTWSQVDTQVIGFGVWYPFYAEILGGGNVQALILVVSDNQSTTRKVKLDDLYIWNDNSVMPYCDFDNTVNNATFSGLITDTANITDSYNVFIASGRPCPADLSVANNFWGPLIAGMTQFMDGFTGPFPYHPPNLFYSQVESLADSPAWAYWAILQTLFDWSVVKAIVGTVLIMEVIRNIVLAWRFIKSLIPIIG